MRQVTRTSRDKDVLEDRWDNERKYLNLKMRQYGALVRVVSFSPSQIVLEVMMAALDAKKRGIKGFTVVCLVPQDYPENSQAKPTITCKPRVWYPHIWDNGTFCIESKVVPNTSDTYMMADWIDFALRMATWKEEIPPDDTHLAWQERNRVPSLEEQRRIRKQLEDETRKMAGEQTQRVVTAGNRPASPRVVSRKARSKKVTVLRDN